MEYQGKSRVKPLRMSGESLEKVISHRPLLVFITVDVRQLVAGFYPILTPFLPNKMLALA